MRIGITTAVAFLCFCEPAASTSDNLVDAGKFYFAFFETVFEEETAGKVDRLLMFRLELDYMSNLGSWKAVEQEYLRAGQDQGHFTFFNAHGISLAKVLLGTRNGSVGPLTLNQVFAYPIVYCAMGVSQSETAVTAVLRIEREGRTLHYWTATMKSNSIDDAALIVTEELFTKFHIQVEKDRNGHQVMEP